MFQSSASKRVGLNDAALFLKLKLCMPVGLGKALSCGAELGSTTDGTEMVKLSLELPLLGTVQLLAGYTVENGLSNALVQGNF